MNNRKNKTLYELMYFSSASESFSEDDIPKILEEARKFNTENNVTGCLVYYKNEFVQILEGEDEVVLELYARISKDSRHANAILLTKAHKNERIFDSWSMAYHKFNKADMESLGDEVFVNNLMTFSQLTKQTTLGTILFWNKVRDLLTKKA